MNWQDQIAVAAKRIAPLTVHTPVMKSKSFSLGHEIELKLEHLQHTGSFKIRGAYNAILSTDVPEAGLVAASGGNHGAAVAYAARSLRHPAHVFVPELAGQTKTSLIRRTGTDLTIIPGTYADALAAAQNYEQETGAVQVHAYDTPATVIGQGTCFSEWEAQGLDADTIIIAVGGGGLISGALGWFEGSRKIVAVEPEACATLKTALLKRRPVDVEVTGIAANALGARRIGDICFDLVQKHRTPAVLVSDDSIEKAQKALWQNHRILVEPAGATALAALISGAYRPTRGEKVAVLLCGGNITPDPLTTP